MSRSRSRTWIVVAGLFVLWLVTPIGTAVSQSIESVFVANFPSLWNVEGKVEIEGPVHLSQLVEIGEVTVPPVNRRETTRLVEAGTLVTDGFPNVVLSLHGEVKGLVTKSGEVGAILIPDEQTIQEAYFEEGQVHFAIEVQAVDVDSKRGGFFASNQPRYTVGFQAYKVMLFNNTDKTVTVKLFAYLTT